MNYYIIGDEDAVLGFGMVGLDGAVADTKDQAETAFDNAIQNKENGIIIITEKAADLIRSKVDMFLFKETFPLIVEIPDRKGKNPNKAPLKELVNEAIGIKL